ncbi:hypothetical protein GOV12_07185 [Candidatus Pacearchaeota archaeon]|nr:hypothetical protein [Candidatus Pacearchaeota archaeon]
MDDSDKCDVESFDYDSMWNKEEEKKDKKKVEELPKGEPRKGLKGKWIKRSKHVTRNQVKNSYNGYDKDSKKKFFG